jgi:hypothetical protein
VIRRILQIVSFSALAGVIAPPVLFLAGSMALDRVHGWMAVSTLIWFAATPFWMGRSER